MPFIVIVSGCGCGEQAKGLGRECMLLAMVACRGVVQADMV